MKKTFKAIIKIKILCLLGHYFWRMFWTSWGVLGGILGGLGGLLVNLGGLLERLGGVLGDLESILGHLGDPWVALSRFGPNKARRGGRLMFQKGAKMEPKWDPKYAKIEHKKRQN